MGRREKATNKFMYEVRVPEKNFEQYLDDMGVLVIGIYDAGKGHNIGNCRIHLKLYIKRLKQPTDESPLIEISGYVLALSLFE